MTWENVPTRVTEWRDRLLECATVQTIFAGIATGAAQQSRFHFADADTTTEPMPYVVLDCEETEAVRAASARSSGSGTVLATFHFDDSYTTGTVEGYAQAIPYELVELVSDGLYVISARAQRSSAPTQAMQATDDNGQTETGRAFRTVDIAAQWEG